MTTVKTAKKELQQLIAKDKRAIEKLTDELADLAESWATSESESDKQEIAERFKELEYELAAEKDSLSYWEHEFSALSEF
jgi:septation ring formation regulator EzrA